MKFTNLKNVGQSILLDETLKRVKIQIKDFNSFLKEHQEEQFGIHDLDCPLHSFFEVNGYINKMGVHIVTIFSDISYDACFSEYYKLPNWASHFSKSVLDYDRLTGAKAMIILENILQELKDNAEKY